MKYGGGEFQGRKKDISQTELRYLGVSVLFRIDDGTGSLVVYLDAHIHRRFLVLFGKQKKKRCFTQLVTGQLFMHVLARPP